jgi:tetratricopeptide (TPR) repeat protein
MQSMLSGKTEGQTGIGKLFKLLLVCIIKLTLICGCTSLHMESSLKEANEYSAQGSYLVSLDKYEQILEKYPETGDRVLFEMGLIHVHPGNWQRNERKSREYFQKIIQDYPKSEYHRASEMMIAHIDAMTVKEKEIATHQAQMHALQNELKRRDGEMAFLNQRISALEQELKSKVYPVQDGPADKIVIEKKARRLTLMTGGQILRQYKIALGGNPEGPKERQGDNKTPEGTYVINSRNHDSRYHLSLRISYPNDKDKKRARELGVCPGGDIMIHGIKNGLSHVGESHALVDWTRGCIAVTDEEIEEIDKLAPLGTVVEIRP